MILPLDVIVFVLTLNGRPSPTEVVSDSLPLHPPRAQVVAPLPLHQLQKKLRLQVKSHKRRKCIISPHETRLLPHDTPPHPRTHTHYLVHRPGSLVHRLSEGRGLQVMHPPPLALSSVAAHHHFRHPRPGEARVPRPSSAATHGLHQPFVLCRREAQWQHAVYLH